MTLLFTLIMMILLPFYGVTTSGISTAQTSAEDTQKQAATLDLQIAIEDYYLNYAEYPQSISVEDTRIFLGELSDEIISEDIASFAEDICYKYHTETKYALGVLQSSGEWMQFGSEDITCNEENTLIFIIR